MNGSFSSPVLRRVVAAVREPHARGSVAGRVRRGGVGCGVIHGAASYMGLEGRSGVRRGSLMHEIETTIENQMNENKVELVVKKPIQRRFFFVV